MSIHIKKSHRGLLHKNLGVKQGEKIPASKLAIKSGDSPAVKKRKQFAINAKHWSKGQSGITLTTLPGSTLPNVDLDAASKISATAEDISSHIPIPRRKKPLNLGNTVLGGLLAIDALLPPERSPYPVVRPGLSYNQNPYGTNSQAIAQYGTTVKAFNPNLAKGDKPFQKWYNSNTLEGKNKIPYSDTLDYDYYSFFKNQGTGNIQNHFPDTYKRPNHQTFSNESIYSIPENTGGSWNGEQFTPSAQQAGRGMMKSMQSGGNIPISTTGYKANSKDKNKKKLRIPSNKITMQNVPHDVLGIDSEGNVQYMTPGNEYQFQGEYVDEIPMAQAGSKPIYTNNPKDPRLQAGRNIPTSADSLALYNNSKLLQNYYKNNPDYQITSFLKSPTLKQMASMNDRSASIFSGMASVAGEPYGKKYRQELAIPKDQYRRDLNENQYFQRENADVILDMNAPMTLFDKRIQPQFQQYYKNVGTTTLNGDLVALYGYDPLAVKPWNMLTTNERQERIKKYGSAKLGRPSTPQRPKGALSNPSLPAYNMSDGNSRPVPSGQPSIQEIPFDSSKPTKFSFTNYTGKNEYFPTKGALDNHIFQKAARNVSSQEGENYKTATGYYGKGGTLSPNKAAEMLRDGTAHKKPLTKKQKKYFQAVAHGWQPDAENGMTILDENTVKFTGDKHSDPSGGQPISYGGKKVMVEGGETGYKSPIDDSLTIMGNMKNPLTGRKFKNDSKILAEKEAKMNELLGQGFELVDNNKPMDKWGSLKFNAGRVMMEGAAKKKKELMSSKEHLKAIQEAMLDTSYEQGIHSQKLSEAKYGAVMQSGGTVPTWKYNQTNTEWLDPKIKEFAELLTRKGLTGYSGPESGLSQRNTKSGRASRHASGEALDAFLSQPDAYNKVLADPELSKYLIDNGLTVINEYDPNVAKQTGATAGHLHIGYDKGTGVSDQFRKDAAAKYRGANTNWGWGTTRNPKGKTIKGAPQGDQQYFPYDAGNVTWKDVTTVPQDTTPERGPQPDYGFNFTQPQPYNLPSNAQDLELTQVLPELYAAATNRVEPVHLQKYQPELYEPYQVSFQDQLNENQATFSSLEKASAYNPSALATLAGQKYSADSGVLGNEFRTNQGIANDITNKNIALINDAELKNLQLADTQYTRQSQARSNTRAVNHGVLNSISAKMLQNQANKNKTQLYENLYNFRFNPKDNYRAYNAGPSGAEYIDWNGDPDVTGNGMSQNQSMKQNYNKTGQLTSTSINTPSLTKQQLDEYNLRNKVSMYPDVKKGLKKSIGQYFNANWNR